MKHAFLIIAHSNYYTLQKLIECLDCEQCDIFIHIDKKTKLIPILHTEKSKIFFCKNRIDVVWSSVSQIESEYSLFEESRRYGHYKYYHVISGAHFPLVKVENIIKSFDAFNQAEIMQFMDTSQNEIKLKLCRYHFFLRGLRNKRELYRKVNHFLWIACLGIQKRLNIYRKQSDNFKKAANWVSLTDSAVTYLLTHKQEIIEKYKFSFCGDEFFAPTELNKAGFYIIDYPQMLFTKFRTGGPDPLSIEDTNDIESSNCMFARKLDDNNCELVDYLTTRIK